MDAADARGRPETNSLEIHISMHPESSASKDTEFSFLFLDLGKKSGGGVVTVQTLGRRWRLQGARTGGEALGGLAHIGTVPSSWGGKQPEARQSLRVTPARRSPRQGRVHQPAMPACQRLNGVRWAAWNVPLDGDAGGKRSSRSTGQDRALSSSIYPRGSVRMLQRHVEPHYVCKTGCDRRPALINRQRFPKASFEGRDRYFGYIGVKACGTRGSVEGDDTTCSAVAR